MSQTPPNRMTAIKEDGFIDFYQLLEVETDATTTRIRTTINNLYNEAQSNRDHRNLNRRREYQTLLQVLPQAREFLLEEKKRTRYDAFREEVQRGMNTLSFDDWVNSLKEEEDASRGESSAVLGVQDDESDGVPRATVIKAPRQPKAVSRVSIGEESTPRPVSATKQSLVGSAISVIVFFVLLLLGFVILKDWTIAMLIGSVGGLITWFATHRKSANRTRV